MLPYDKLSTLAAGKRDLKNQAREFILESIADVVTDLARNHGKEELVEPIMTEARALAKKWNFSNYFHWDR